MLSKYDQDNWIKSNLPTNSSPEMRAAMEVVMRLAYAEGYSRAEKDQRSRQISEERERQYGPDL